MKTSNTHNKTNAGVFNNGKGTVAAHNGKSATPVAANLNFKSENGRVIMYQ